MLNVNLVACMAAGLMAVAPASAEVFSWSSNTGTSFSTNAADAGSSATGHTQSLGFAARSAAALNTKSCTGVFWDFSVSADLTDNSHVIAPGLDESSFTYSSSLQGMDDSSWVWINFKAGRVRACTAADHASTSSGDAYAPDYGDDYCGGIEGCRRAAAAGPHHARGRHTRRAASGAHRLLSDSNSEDDDTCCYDGIDLYYIANKDAASFAAGTDLEVVADTSAGEGSGTTMNGLFNLSGSADEADQTLAGESKKLKDVTFEVSLSAHCAAPVTSEKSATTTVCDQANGTCVDTTRSSDQTYCLHSGEQLELTGDITIDGFGAADAELLTDLFGAAADGTFTFNVAQLPQGAGIYNTYVSVAHASRESVTA